MNNTNDNKYVIITTQDKLLSTREDFLKVAEKLFVSHIDYVNINYNGNIFRFWFNDNYNNLSLDNNRDAYFLTRLPIRGPVLVTIPKTNDYGRVEEGKLGREEILYLKRLLNKK